MQTFLHYRWSVPSTLHRLHPRRIIPLLLLALCVTGAKAQSDVKFNGDIRYSKWVIDSRMNDFYANTTPCGFAVYDQSGTQTSTRVNGKDKLDYVVGLVAKSIIEASQYYSQYTWAQSFAKPWFLSIKDYGDNFYDKFKTIGGSLDDLNAVKLFIPLRALTETNGKYPDATTYAHTTTALNTALTGLSTHNSSYSIKSGTTAETAGKTVAGGWWHKSDYQDQMWLDGSYMGPALFAELVNYSGTKTNIDATNDWDLIVKQFTILRNMCWNSDDKLLYHAFAADGGTNSTSHSDTWFGLRSTPTPTYCFHSASYWGRAVGWYFLALVDILEQMQKANIASTDSKFTTLKGYLEEIAEGIRNRQDQTGGWYQILDKGSDYSASSYDNGQQHTTTYNYIESSATALFTAAYLKAIRLGYLANDYKTVAENGYKCLVNNFFSVDENGKVNIFGSCRSAGLGGKGDDYIKGNIKYRNGSNEYYLLGSDVARVDKSENETEGKVLGAFIMAATEYEMANEKDIRFSSDLAPTYTLSKGQSLKVEALGSGDITYQWYKDDSLIDGATSESYFPTGDGSYYCEAKTTQGGVTTTIKTSKAAVTVSNSAVIFSYTVNSSEVAANTEYTATGGTVKYGANKYETNYGFKSDDNLGLKKYMFVSLSGNKLQEGDVICIKAYSAQNNGGIYAAVNNTASSDYDDLGTLSQKETVENLSYTVKSSDAINGLSGIYLYRNGVSTYIQEVTITRTASSSSLSITNQPTGETYDVNASSVNELKFEVSTTGTETITYKWYSNTTNSTEGGTLIQNGPSSTYTPPVTTAGTTYYYCIASAGDQSVTSKVVAVAVLNPSDLKTKYNAAWTPIANGTIEVGNLVTSSSKGAYSITAGNDVATISGTTITALKAGTFTLSQAADDTYKEGSIVITVRIGTNVISDGTNKYSFTAQTDVSDGMTITCKDITMTFGNDGFWSQAPANGYTGGQVNPQVSAYIPTAGTFYKFTPTKPGSLAVKIRLGHLNGKLRPLYVSENGTLIKAKDKNGTELDPENMPAPGSTYVDNVTFNVKKGKDYYVYVTGSKLGFYDFVFTTATVYTVTYNMNGHGTQIDAVTDDNTLPETLPTPTADGYTFVAWYTDKALTQEATPGAAISAPTTLYAKWTPITDLFSLTVVRSTTQSVASQTAYDVKSADATVTGGSVQLYNGNSKASADMIINSQINLKGSGGSYIKITLGNTLQAGDEIIINPSSSSFKLSNTNSTSNSKSFTGSYVIQTGDAVVGQNVIYLYRNENSVIDNLSISRYYPESDSRATFTYNGTPIAFSEKTTGVYTTTLEIGARKKGKTITITPSVKEGASIKQGETVVSESFTITVPSTIGQTTTSTYTVTSKDGTSTTTYEINVKLVKENVVLEYAQREVTSSGEIINIKKEWTWDKTANSARPTFTNPKLKVYLANADGTPSNTEVTVTGIKYMSDVTDVATVNETTGAITIQKNANGGAKIYAILEGHSDYNDTNTFFNIVVKQGYSYSVATDAEVTNGPSLNQPVYIKNGETNLVKMTFGGWKWKTFKEKEDNPKLISTYEVNSSPRTDGWNKPATSDETEIASIDGYKTYISGYSDAVDESKEASKKEIYGSIRYGWFKPAETRISDKYLETYPYTLPVRGAYMTFEPTQNGTLTVYILQNGAWNTFDQDTQIGGVLYKNGDIKPGEFRPHSFYICNQRGLNADQFSPNTFTYTTKQKVQGDYYCNLTSNTDDPYNIASWKEFKEYMSDKEKKAVATNWNNGINGGQSIVQLDNGSFLAIQKGIVKYTFFVTANETYYLFSNFSKLGFCGANFVPSKDIIPADDDAHKITLSDETAYPKPVKVTGNTDEDKNKYAWKFGNEIKGYVPGFTIPLFNSITLNRTFKKNQWTTLTLPFNLTQTEVEQIFGKGTQILVFQDAQTEGTKLHIKFFYHEIQNILPGYPYLIKPTLEGYDGTPSTANAPIYMIDSSSGNLTSFTVYDKAINPNIEQHEFTAIKDQNYVAKGTPDYCKEDEKGVCKKQYEEGDLFISDTNGKLYISKGSSYGKGYRSYIDGPASSATKTLSLSFSGVEDGEDDGTTTEISVAELADDVIEAFGIKGVYNLNGQKVSETTRNLPAGIYVVNGRKVVVK